MKLLITSAESRKCFDIFNILNPKLKKIYLSSNLGFFKRTLLSIVYLKRVFKTEKILKLIQANTMDIKIFPIDEADIEAIYDLDLMSSSLLPDKNSFYSMVNKKQLFEYANKNNIPCPKTLGKDHLDSNFIVGEVVVKPSRGTGSEGVKFFDNYDNAGLYLNSLDDSSDFLVQELIGKNNVVAGCYLFDDGNLISFYGHERLRTYPATGGVTVCSVSHNNQKIMNLGQQLLSPLKWSGLVMVEFMWSDVINDYQLIEVNPRAWGSIMLSEKCGSNMLMKYVDLIFGNAVDKSEGKESFYIKWLVPYDIINLIKGGVPLSDYKYRKNTCLINISYSGLIQSSLFHVFQFTQIGKIAKKFFLK
ncbi:ATP-grasp domain-containing protein [Gammaproteobacteria bacterium]|nr:ATP-grasp domain-containing protein [Gammaproteobacteria bacterium]